MNEVDRWYHSCQILLVREWQANCRVWVWPLYTDNKWCIIAHDKIEGENQAEFKGETFFLDNTLHYICIIYTVACQLAISFCHAINPTWVPPINSKHKSEWREKQWPWPTPVLYWSCHWQTWPVHALSVTNNQCTYHILSPTHMNVILDFARGKFNSLIWI